MKTLLLAAVTLTLVSSAQSATILFDLQGTAGSGILAANEIPAVTGGGSGGEVGAGISFDTSTNILTINIAWGSINGFTNLTGNPFAAHLHGPTAGGGALGFSQSGGVIAGIDTIGGWNPSATGGGITSGLLTLTAAQAINLLAEKTYINVHTQTNQGGEMRGNLVIVPEPSHAILSLLGLAAFGARRKR